MWKPLLISLWLLLLLQPDCSYSHRAVSCGTKVYRDCAHYCQLNCDELDNNCQAECDDGCGCVPAFVQRNNGGCVEIRECELNTGSDEEKEEALVVTPCSNVVEQPTAEDGEELLNLLEFNTQDPFG